MFLKPIISLPGQAAGTLLRANMKVVTITGVRCLYNAEGLGLNAYQNGRNKTKIQFEGLKDKFYEKMVEFSDPESSNMVFTEDLKHVLHLATDEDLELVRKMLLKYNAQNKELRFGSFTFGPVVMRLYHHLNKPDEALEIFLNEDFQSFFSQNNTYQVLLDLLYNNDRYDDVIKVFSIIENKQNQGTRYPKTIVIIYLASLYKLNTPESFNLTCELFKKLDAAGHVHVRRAICYATALAINQQKYNEAMEFISLQLRHSNYVTIRSLKMLALLGLKRHDEVLPILHSFLQEDVPEFKYKSTKQTVFCNVIEKVKSEFESLDSVELKSSFNKLYNQLKEFDHICDTTLDEFLSAEIVVKPKEEQFDRSGNFTRSRYNAGNPGENFREKDSYNKRGSYRRPGLSDYQ